MPDRQQLLSDYVENASHSAFRELVGRYVDFVYATAVRSTGGDAEMAKDVTQVVFADLSRMARTFSKGVMLGGWLHRHTCYTAAKAVRAERRRRARERGAVEMDSAGDHSEHRLAELWPILDAAIEKLNADDRAAILLRFFEDQDLRSIGSALGISENAAQKRVSRSLEELRRRLERQGVSVGGIALSGALARAAAAVAPPGLSASVSSVALAKATALEAAKVVFMTTAQKVLLAAAIAVSAGAFVYQGRQASMLAGRAHALDRETAAVEARQRSIRGNLGRLRAQLNRVRASRAVAGPKGTTPTAIAGADSGWDPIAGGNQFLARHPDVKRALEDYGRARVEWECGPLLESFHLPPEKLDQLIEILERGNGMGANGPDGPWGTKPIEMMEGGGMLDSGKYTEAMNGILTADQAAELWNWKRYAVARDLASRVAGLLWSTSTPLTPAQADELVQIVGPSKGLSVDMDSVLAKAGAVLAPAQLEVLNGMQAENLYNRTINTP